MAKSRKRLCLENQTYLVEDIRRFLQDRAFKLNMFLLTEQSAYSINSKTFGNLSRRTYGSHGKLFNSQAQVKIEFMNNVEETLTSKVLLEIVSDTYAQQIFSVYVKYMENVIKYLGLDITIERPPNALGYTHYAKWIFTIQAKDINFEYTRFSKKWYECLFLAETSSVDFYPAKYEVLDLEASSLVLLKDIKREE